MDVSSPALVPEADNVTLLDLTTDILRELVQRCMADKSGGQRALRPLRLTCQRLRDVADTCVSEVTVALQPEQGAWQLALLHRYKAMERLHIDLRHACQTSVQLCSLLASIVQGCNRLRTLHVVCGFNIAESWMTGPCQSRAQLSDTLGCLQNLRSLRLAGSAPVTSSQVLAAALLHSTSLQSLEIDVAISNHGLAVMAPSLQGNRALTTLHLRQAAIGDGGAEALSASLAQNAGLVTLDLSKNSIGTSGCRTLAQALTVNRTLLSLDLSFNGVSDPGATMLGEMLLYNGTLQELGLRFNTIGPKGCAGLAAGVEQHPSLRTLDLSQNSIQDWGAGHIGDALRGNRVLETLKLTHADISDEGAAKLGTGLALNGTLHHLHLAHNRIGAAGALALASALSASYLLDEGQYAGRAGGDEDASSMDSSYSSDSEDDMVLDALQRLALGGSAGAPYKFAAPPGLRSLDLNFNSVGDAGARALGGLFAELPQSRCQLATLLLEDNGIGGSGAELLASFVASSHALAVLSLSRNMIGDAGACALGLALQMNHSMQVLCVEACCVKEAGALGLAVGLKVSPTLQAVHAQGNSFQFVRLKLQRMLQFCQRKVSFLF